MADRYWDGGTSTDPTNVNNWSDTDGGVTPASSVPGTGDHAHFTANGDGNPCTMTAAWTLGDLTFLVGYTSKFDMAGYSITLDDGGSITLDGGGEFDTGGGAISVTNGTFDNKDQSTYTRTTTDSVTLNGTCTFTSGTTKDISILNIAAGATVTHNASCDIREQLNVLGTLSIGSGKSFYVSATCCVSVGAAGSITGDGTFIFNVPYANSGLTSFASGGTIDVANFQIWKPYDDAIFVSGTFDSADVLLYNNSSTSYKLTLSSGTYTFNGAFNMQTASTGTITLDRSVGNPDLVFKGDVTSTKGTGDVIHTKGTGTITLSGTADQDVDFNGKETENVEIDKTTSGYVSIANGDFALGDVAMVDDLTFATSTITAVAGSTVTASGASAQAWDLDDQTIGALVVNKSAGTLTFGGGWTAASYLQSDGDVDFNGQTVITTGDFQINAGATVASGTDTMNSADITVGGNFFARGVSGTLLNLRGTAGWSLTVSGAARVSYADVSYCDATGGAMVAATDGTSTDNSNNTGWVWYAVGAPLNTSALDDEEWFQSPLLRMAGSRLIVVG